MDKSIINVRNSAIIVVMAVTFAVAWRILSPSEASVGGAAEQPTVEPRRGGGEQRYEGAAAAPASFTNALSWHPAAPMAVGKPAAAAAMPIVDFKIPPATQEGPPLPIMLNIVNKSVYFSEENDDGTRANVARRVNEAIVTSLSQDPLVISVVETNIPTQEKVEGQFLLGKDGQRHFGIDLGLKMQSGDQLVLRSPGFKDTETLIP